jgi:hypothetical protein
VVLYRHPTPLSVPTSGPAISSFFDIAQGAGLASATGVRPFLPPLLAGALASGDLGLDFDGTAFAFLESPGFLAAVLALAVLSYALERRGVGSGAGVGRSGGESSAASPRSGLVPRDPASLVFVAAAIVLGALLFAGSLAAGGDEPWLGLVAGAACALLGVAAVTGLLGRVRRRLDDSAAALLPAWADGAALLLAGISILFPPLALLGVAALLYVLVAGRRAREGKYEGLRVLR